MRRRHARTPNLYPRQNGPFWEHCFREEDVRPELARANEEIDRLHRRLWEKRKEALERRLRSEIWALHEADAQDAKWVAFQRLGRVIRMEYKP